MAKNSKGKYLKRGQHPILASYVGKPATTIRRYYSDGKLDSFIRPDGTYKLEAAKEWIAGGINKKYQMIREKQWEDKSESSKESIQESKPGSKSEPATEDEVKSYLDETIGYLSTLDLNGIVLRHEFEKLLMAKIKRRQVELTLIEAEAIIRECFAIGQALREGLESISERCAALVAVESDQHQCREILYREHNQLLTDICERLNLIAG